jgi:hypothetical protein
MMGNQAQARLIGQELLDRVMGKAVDHTAVQAIQHATMRLECVAEIGA